MYKEKQKEMMDLIENEAKHTRGRLKRMKAQNINYSIFFEDFETISDLEDFQNKGKFAQVQFFYLGEGTKKQRLDAGISTIKK